MHVNNNQFQPQVDLNSSNSEFKLKTLNGNLQGRSTTVIASSDSNNAAAIKLAAKANTQFQNINLQSTDNTAPLQASSLKRKKASTELSQTEKTALMQNFATAFKENPNKHMYKVETRDGKIIAKSINHEDIKNNPLSADAKIVTAQEVDGQLFIHGHENSPLEIDEVHDEHGQVREFQFLALDDELYSQLQDIVSEHIENYIATKMLQHQETKETNKDETTTDDKPTQHTPQPPRYEYKPKIEEKQDNKELINDTSKLLSENPKVILKNVLEAESLLEAKKMNQERAQEAKKKLIDEQEERREIRHEGYKHDEIKQSKQQHDILNETIHHQETERPASVSTTQQSKQDEK